MSENGFTTPNLTAETAKADVIRLEKELYDAYVMEGPDNLETAIAWVKKCEKEYGAARLALANLDTDYVVDKKYPMRTSPLNTIYGMYLRTVAASVLDSK